MDKREIEEAVERMRSGNCEGRDIKLLIDVAQLFLSVKGMPKKRDFEDRFAITDKTPKEFKWDFRLENAKVIAHNLCHDEFTAHLVKKCEGIENVQLPYPATFTEASPDGVMNKITLSYEAARAIQEYLLKGVVNV